MRLRITTGTWIALVSVAGILSWGVNAADADTEQSRTPDERRIESAEGPSSEASTDNSGGFDCIIEPSARVELASESSGVLHQIDVKRGDKVRKGQVIASLRSGIEKAAVALAEARASDVSKLDAKKTKSEYEKRRYDRHRGVISANAVTRQEADEIRTASLVAEFEREAEEAELQRAQIELQRTKAALEARRIFSPIDGVVLSVDKEPGEYISGEAVVTVVAVDPLNVEMFVPLAVASRMKPDETVMVLPRQGEPSRAVVRVIDRVADAASGTVKVLLSMDNPDHAIFAGQNCRARIDASGGSR